MKKEKISQALHGIDENYVEKAENYTKKKISMPILKWGALAASLAFVIAGAAIAMPHLTADPMYSETTPLTENEISMNGQETVLETVERTETAMAWIDWPTNETEGGTQATAGIQYSARVESGVFAKYLPMAVIEENAVGEKLADVSVKAYWHNMAIRFEDAETEAETVEHLRAEVYAIKGVSAEASVCVKYLDKGDALTTTHYYVFVNPEAKPQTLAAFLADFDANAYLSVKEKNVHIGRLTATESENTIYTLCAENIAALGEMLLALDGTAIEYTEKSTLAGLLQSCHAQASIPIDFDSVGALTANARVLDNGYLIFTVFSSNEFVFAFEIGEEKAKMMIEYIEENAERKMYSGTETIIAETLTESTSMETVQE